MILSAFPALLTFLIRVFVPESEMWEAQAKKKENQPRLADLFRGGLAKHTVIGSALGAVALMGTWASVQWIPGWAGKLATGIPNAAARTQIASAVGAIAFSLVFALIAERFNRRLAYFALSLLSLVACAILFRLDIHFGTPFLWAVFFVGGITCRNSFRRGYGPWARGSRSMPAASSRPWGRFTAATWSSPSAATSRACALW
jgi:hypothetical protein